MPNSLQDRALNDLENEPLDEKKDIPSIILPPVSHITSSTYIFSLCAALNSCNLGYDIGVNTSAGPLLQSSLSLSTAQLELFMGSLSLMAIVGSFFASFFADRYGRLPGFIFASLGFIIGLVILCLATSFVTLMIGRALIGMGVGFGLAMDPLYIAEISPQSHRGKLVTFSETAINVGIVLGFAAGFLSEEKFGGWRVMYGLGLIMPIFLILVIVCRLMPESPRWLISQRRHTEAQLVLEKIYPPGYPISQLVQHISETIQWEKQQQYSSVRQNPTWIQGLCQQITEKWSLIRHSSPAVRRMLIVGLGAATTQQLVGVDAIQYYLIFILQEAGIPPGQRQTLILVALGFVKMIVIVLAGYLFDRIGRRSLMFASLAGSYHKYFNHHFIFFPTPSLTLGNFFKIRNGFSPLYYFN
jgi:MFS family permease